MVLLLFYLAAMPRNHSDTEDAYHYAHLAEESTPAQRLHAHHMLYLPIVHGLFRLARAGGYTGRSFPLLVAFSAVCGAAAVAFFAGLLRRRALLAGRPAASRFVLPWALGLAFSFGFWRYAMAAEIVTVTLLCAVMVYSLTFRGGGGTVRFAIVLAASGIGILVHLHNAIPLLAGITVYYGLRRRWAMALWHGVGTMLLVGCGYILLQRVAGVRLDLLGSVHRDHGFGPGSLFRGGVAFGQSIVSGNFLFGYEEFTAWITARLPERMLEEEGFMGRQAPGLTKVIPWMTLTGCAVMALWAGCLSFRSWARPSLRNLVRTWFRSESFAMDAAWITWGVGHAAAILWIHPGNPEMWVPLSMPLWYIAFLLFRHEGKAAGRAAVPWLLCLGLLLHNAVGGIWPLRSEKGDYLAAKAAPILAQVRPEDIIITGDTEVFIRYLAYHTSAGLVSAADLPPEILENGLPGSEGRLYVLGDVFRPPSALALRFPERAIRARAAAGLLAEETIKLAEDDFGGYYEWLPAPDRSRGKEPLNEL